MSEKKKRRPRLRNFLNIFKPLKIIKSLKIINNTIDVVFKAASLSLNYITQKINEYEKLKKEAKKKKALLKKLQRLHILRSRRTTVPKISQDELQRRKSKLKRLQRMQQRMLAAFIHQMNIHTSYDSQKSTHKKGIAALKQTRATTRQNLMRRG